MSVAAGQTCTWNTSPRFACELQSSTIIYLFIYYVSFIIITCWWSDACCVPVPLVSRERGFGRDHLPTYWWPPKTSCGSEIVLDLIGHPQTDAARTNRVQTRRISAGIVPAVLLPSSWARQVRANHKLRLEFFVVTYQNCSSQKWAVICWRTVSAHRGRYIPLESAYRGRCWHGNRVIVSTKTTRTVALFGDFFSD